MKALLLSVLFFCSLAGGLAQDTAYFSFIGGNNYDALAKAVRIGNSYYLVGSTSSAGYGNSDVYFVKTDTMGNVEDTWITGSEQSDKPTSVTVIGDTLLAVCGYTNRQLANGYDVLLIMSDTAGNILSEHTYGGDDWDLAYDIMYDPAGYLLIAGQTFSNGAAGGDGFLYKVETNGNIVWQKTYGGAGFDLIKRVMPFYGTRYLLAGSFTPVGESKTDITAIWTDSNGAILDSVMYGSALREVLNDVLVLPDTTLILAGGRDYTGNDTTDFELVRMDTSGAVLWTVHYDYSLNTEEWKDIHFHIPSQSIMVAGDARNSSFGNGGMETYLFRLSKDGIYENLTTFGFSKDEFTETVLAVNAAETGTFIIAGTTNDVLSNGGSDFFLARTNISGSLVNFTFLNYFEPPVFYISVGEYISNSIQVTKEQDILYITSSDPFDSYTLYDVTGKKVLQQSRRSESSEIHLYSFTNGIYILEIYKGTERSIFKINR
jgi:hypothetical protein